MSTHICVFLSADGALQVVAQHSEPDRALIAYDVFAVLDAEDRYWLLEAHNTRVFRKLVAGSAIHWFR